MIIGTSYYLCSYITKLSNNGINLDPKVIRAAFLYLELAWSPKELGTRYVQGPGSLARSLSSASL